LMHLVEAIAWICKRLYMVIIFDLQSKIIMKVLFLAAAIAVCLMTFAPTTDAWFLFKRVGILYKTCAFKL